jgi:hypothetical protein
MLRLYYSGSRTYLGIQGKKELSLGGFPSSTVIPNDQQNNLFSSITQYAIQNELREVIAIILKNESDSELSNIEFYFDAPENAIGKFQIAAVALSLDSKNQYAMEEIGNNQSLPYSAEFHEATGIENAVSLGPLGANKMLGLWIKREIDATIKTDDEMWTDYINETVILNKETVSLMFNETIVEDSSSSSSSI